MKATIVLIANNQTANIASKLLLEANRIGDLGFEMTRLPFHVSLKQPFIINNLNDFEEFFDEYSKTLRSVNVHFEELVSWKNSVLGYDSGVMVLRVEKTEELANMHQELNKQLEEKFGTCKADFDGDKYQFHMTIAIGGKSYSEYEKVLEELRKKELDFNTVFNELALFYYDSDEIKPGTYYCYKRVNLK
jgi:2'-5' RNA ligase